MASADTLGIRWATAGVRPILGSGARCQRGSRTSALRRTVCGIRYREASWQTSSSTSRSTRPSRSGSSTSTASCSGGRSRSSAARPTGSSTPVRVRSDDDPRPRHQRRAHPAGGPCSRARRPDQRVQRRRRRRERCRRSLPEGTGPRRHRGSRPRDMEGVGRGGYLLDPDGNIFGLMSPVLSDGTVAMGPDAEAV